MKEILIAALTLAAGCSTARSTKDIPVVRNFEAARYMGVWHEIARLPKWFERGLDNVTATYSPEGDTFKIVNRGFRNGEEVVSTAVGKLAGATDEGAFRVSFFRPFYGDYRIIYLSPDYDLALVTGGDRSSLWILAREKTLTSEQKDRLVQMARERGFDTNALEYPK